MPRASASWCGLRLERPALCVRILSGGDPKAFEAHARAWSRECPEGASHSTGGTASDEEASRVEEG